MSSDDITIEDMKEEYERITAARVLKSDYDALLTQAKALADVLEEIASVTGDLQPQVLAARQLAIWNKFIKGE